MNKISTQKNILILNSLILIFSISGFIFISILLETRKNEMVEQINDLNVNLLARKSLTEIENDLGFAYRANEFFNKLYINKDELLDFIENIEDLAKQQNVNLNIDAINQESINQDSFFPQRRTEVEMPLRFRGKMIDNLNFLNILENLPYYIELSNHSIQLFNRSEQIYEFSLTIKILTR